MSQVQTRSSVRAAEAAAAESFDNIIALPEAVLVDQLKTGDYKQIQEFCRFLGITVKGARAELERRILEFKLKLDASEVQLHSNAMSDPRSVVPVGGVDTISTPEPES